MMILENYTREQFREWLTHNHDTAKEVFIVIDRRKHSFLLKDYAKGKILRIVVKRHLQHMMENAKMDVLLI